MIIHGNPVSWLTYLGFNIKVTVQTFLFSLNMLSKALHQIAYLVGFRYSLQYLTPTEWIPRPP